VVSNEYVDRVAVKEKKSWGTLNNCFLFSNLEQKTTQQLAPHQNYWRSLKDKCLVVEWNLKDTIRDRTTKEKIEELHFLKKV
jgi:hypothetical protein